MAGRRLRRLIRIISARSGMSRLIYFDACYCICYTILVILENIQKSFQKNTVLYSRHALVEMRSEEFGRISDTEVFESILNSEIIMEYPEDKPYPSVLIFGKTKKNRPLHIVCAFNSDEELAIVITVYQPNPKHWKDFKRRKQ